VIDDRSFVSDATSHVESIIAGSEPIKSYAAKPDPNLALTELYMDALADYASEFAPPISASHDGNEVDGTAVQWSAKANAGNVREFRTYGQPFLPSQRRQQTSISLRVSQIGRSSLSCFNRCWPADAMCRSS
jgi:hypothetical protein